MHCLMDREVFGRCISQASLMLQKEFQFIVLWDNFLFSGDSVFLSHACLS